MGKFHRNCIAAALLMTILLYGCDRSSEETVIPEHVPSPASETVPEIVSLSTEAANDLSMQTDAVQTAQNLDADMIYDTLCEKLFHYENTVTLNSGVDGDILEEVFFRITREHPELFWINGYSARCNENSASIQFIILDDLRSDKLKRMSRELETTAKAIVAAASALPTDYEKVQYVHDYIVEHTEYDNVGAEMDANGIWGTAYGCLVNGSAVCQGYSEAFLLIMNQLGIPCGICSGMTERGSHAWNYVMVDGAYYWLDATWDDPSFTSGEEAGLRHTYFLISDEQINRSRTINSDGFIPVCTSMENNYFVRTQNYLTEYRFSDIDVRMAAAAPEDGIEVMYASREAYETAIRELFVNGEIWNASAFGGDGGNVYYTGDDDMYVLRIRFASGDDKNLFPINSE